MSGGTPVKRQSLALALASSVLSSAATRSSTRAAVEDVNGWAFFGHVVVPGRHVRIIGNRLPIERLRASLRSGASVGLASSTSYALILLAYTRADAANVATLRSTSILFGLALVLRTLTRPLVVGAMVTVVGGGRW